MAKEIRTPNKNKFNGGEHIEFHKGSLQICIRNGEAIKYPELITDYEGKVKQEENIYKWMGSSKFTGIKVIADDNRDKDVMGLTGVVRAMTKHFDPTISESAKHVLKLIKNYGDLAHAEYNVETAGIDSLIEKLNSSNYSHAVEVLGIAPWLVELEKHNNIFKSYVVETEQELVERPSIRPQTARKETDEALNKIINRVTSLIDIDGRDAYLPFINEFNVHVDLYNNHLRERYGRLHTRIDVSDAEIDDIGRQLYTGKPVNVIPIVKLAQEEKDGLVTIVELAFSKDFTVGYKNNVDPGTATLIITGIGKYTGEIVTTFNIAEKE
jgi:hypothetical protein